MVDGVVVADARGWLRRTVDRIAVLVGISEPGSEPRKEPGKPGRMPASEKR